MFIEKYYKPCASNVWNQDSFNNTCVEVHINKGDWM